MKWMIWGYHGTPISGNIRKPPYSFYQFQASVQAMVWSTPCGAPSFCIGFGDMERTEDATCMQALLVGLRGGSDIHIERGSVKMREARCPNFAAACPVGGSQVPFSHLICGDGHRGNLTARSFQVSQVFLNEYILFQSISICYL